MTAKFTKTTEVQTTAGAAAPSRIAVERIGHSRHWRTDWSGTPAAA